MSLGENLKRRRRACNMTVEEVANRLGVSRQTVFRYENGGIATIPSGKLQALAEIFGTTPAILLGGEESEMSSNGKAKILHSEPRVITLTEDPLPWIYNGKPANMDLDCFREGMVHAEDDGMSRLRLYTGDLVAYESSPPENGKLAVIRLDGHTVVRRYYNDFPEKGWLTLVPEGKGETLTLSEAERTRVELLGHALYFRVSLEYM